MEAVSSKISESAETEFLLMISEPTGAVCAVESTRQLCDMTKRLMSFPKCRSVEVINNPARPGSNHREVNCINYS